MLLWHTRLLRRKSTFVLGCTSSWWSWRLCAWYLTARNARRCGIWIYIVFFETFVVASLAGDVMCLQFTFKHCVCLGKDIQDLTVPEPAPPDDPAIVAINPVPAPQPAPGPILGADAGAPSVDLHSTGGGVPGVGPNFMMPGASAMGPRGGSVGSHRGGLGGAGGNGYPPHRGSGSSFLRPHRGPGGGMFPTGGNVGMNGPSAFYDDYMRMDRAPRVSREQFLLVLLQCTASKIRSLLVLDSSGEKQKSGVKCRFLSFSFCFEQMGSGGNVGGRYNNSVVRHRGDYSDNNGMRTGGYMHDGRNAGQRGTNYGPRRIIGELTAQPNRNLKSQVEEAFDFDEANSKFDKSTIVPTVQEGTATGSTTEMSEAKDTTTSSGSQQQNTSGAATTSTAASLLANVKQMYDKKVSFFDTISCEALDRQSGNESRVDRNKQRQLDVETFGQSATQLQRRGPRGYRRPGGYRRGGGNVMQFNDAVHCVQGYMPLPPIAAVAGGGGNARGYPSYPFGGRF